jgi:hypothetical protein
MLGRHLAIESPRTPEIALIRQGGQESQIQTRDAGPEYTKLALFLQVANSQGEANCVHLEQGRIFPHSLACAMLVVRVLCVYSARAKAT